MYLQNVYLNYRKLDNYLARTFIRYRTLIIFCVLFRTGHLFNTGRLFFLMLNSRQDAYLKHPVYSIHKSSFLTHYNRVMQGQNIEKGPDKEVFPLINCNR